MSSLEDFLGKRLSGGEIKEIRRIMGLSQDRFSKVIGVASMAVYAWESGKRQISEESQDKILAIINDFLGHDAGQGKEC